MGAATLNQFEIVANPRQCYGPEIIPWLTDPKVLIGPATAFLRLSTYVVIETVPILTDKIGCWT
jgi:hypothetical protein